MASLHKKVLTITNLGVRFASASTNFDHNCKVLILGGGTGGCSAAAKFCYKLGKGNVIVIDPADKHYYQPMYTLIGAGIKPLEASSRPMVSVLPKKAKWIQDSVSKIHPHDNYVTTDMGLKISYEYLIVALGIESHFEKIKGLQEALDNPRSGVSCNYSPKYVEKTHENMKNLKEGNAIFTFPNTPIKCAGAPLKACYLTEDYIRRSGRRDKVNFYYRTSLPVIFSVKHYAEQLLKLCKERDIDVGMKQELIEVNHVAKEAKFRQIDRPLEVETVRYSMLHAVPPMSAPKLLAESNKDLVDHAGYLKINKATLQHDVFPNIFGIGDCTNLPTSKTAAAAAGQVGILYKNLSCIMSGKDSSSKYDGYTSCPLVTGFGGCILAEFDYNLQPLETFPLIDQSKEHLSMYIMKKDFMPFLYWYGMVRGHWSGPNILRKMLHLGQSK